MCVWESVYIHIYIWTDIVLWNAILKASLYNKYGISIMSHEIIYKEKFKLYVDNYLSIQENKIC